MDTRSRARRPIARETVARPGPPQHRAAAGRAAVRAADRPRRRGRDHARLSRAGRGEHGARRPVRQPHQHEPARGQGHHLRRAARRSISAGGRGRSRCRPACRLARNGDGDPRIDRRRSRRSAESGRSRPTSSPRRGRAHPRLRAELRNRRADRAAPWLQLALYDLPDDYFSQFVPRVESLTPEEVMAAAARHLDPARLTHAGRRRRSRLRSGSGPAQSRCTCHRFC